MEIPDWLRSIAPTVASALGGPLAGMAVGAITEALGGDSDKAREILATGKLDSADIAAIKQAEINLKLREKEMGLDFAKIEAADRQSARSMQMSLRSNVPAILSFVVTGGYFSILGGMMSGLLAVADSQALLIMLGSLGTAWGMVMAFWFGTTSNSTTKTEIIAKSNPVK
jgi:hypothetical protein